TYSEGSGPVQITGTITVTDPDNTSLASATIKISSNYQSQQDVLSFITANGISPSWNAATGTMTLSGTASLENYSNALRNVTYNNTSLNPSMDDRTISFTVNDDNDPSNTVYRTVRINSKNDPPVVGDIPDQTINEGETFAEIDLDDYVSDPDDPDAQITWNYEGNSELLVNISRRRIATITLPSANWFGSDTITFIATDHTGASDSDSAVFTVININDKPVLDNIEGQSLLYNQGSGDITVTNTITIDDIDNENLQSATIRILGYNEDEDRLLIADQPGMDENWNEITGVLTLSSNRSLENYQAALRSIRYENTNTIDPSFNTRIIHFVVNDGNLDSDPVTREIDINRSPVLTNLEAESIIYCRNSGRVAVTASLDVTDVNDPLLAGATIHITGQYANGQDVLSFTAPRGSGINGIFDPSTGILTLSGTARTNDYETALKSVRFENTEPVEPVTGIREISFAVTDGKIVSNTLKRNINIVVPRAYISGSDEICEHSSANITITLSEGKSPYKFSYNLNGGLPVEILNATNPRTLSVKEDGLYRLVAVTDDNNCSGIVGGSAEITVIPAPEVTISGLEPAYSYDMLRIPVFGEPENGTFIPRSYLIMSNDTTFFYPIIAEPGTHSIIFRYLDPETYCYGYDTALVRVLVANADILFPDDRHYYCNNDRPFTITGVNTVNKTGSFTIEGGKGLTDNGNNTATIDPSVLNNDIYTITYKYFDGTNLQVSESMTIGSKPDANFMWETECFQSGQPIKLNDQSVSNGGTITSYKWLFYKGSGYDSIMTKNVSYTYAQPGNYNIGLHVRTSNGCSDTTIKVFALRPTIRLAGQTYFEDFEDRPVEWRSEKDMISVNSWSLGAPFKGFSGASSGNNCWYTYIPVTNAPREQSWITSPCFDFTGTERPTIKLDIWRLFNSVRDGAIIQASADSGKTWRNVGELEDGINWFNEYNILGTPGGQTLGWSDIRDGNWVEARHSLDMFGKQNRVQFRIAYGSDGTARNTDGIAFDNIWIGERNRVPLLEHFTNSSDTESKDANLLLNAMDSENHLNMINLQYHTAFPGYDPFNEQNPYVPNVRLLYYGLSDVPYSVLDGGSESGYRFDYDLRTLDERTILIRSLSDSKFWININAGIIGNTLDVEAEILALQDIPTSELTVHLAVTERWIDSETGNNGETEFYNVIKTLLPDAGGTTLYKKWEKGDYQYVNHKWDIQNVYDLYELRVVAFIQDESTKEVYQAALDTVEILTGFEGQTIANPVKKNFIVFPDPASTRSYIRFKEFLRQDVKLEILNDLGVLVHADCISAGEIEFEFNVENFADGIYFIRLTDENQWVGISKLTVQH
ncbi:MAG: PKD domain-containing protein, partial [Bacteroidales bacterium]|nr:PKD domain-containing protein [Bacteroidales bacterium]